MDDNWIDEFIESLSGLAELTRTTYARGLWVWVRSGIALDVDCLARFGTWLQAEKYGKATCRLYLISLRRGLEWLESRDRLEFSLSKCESRLKTSRGAVRNGHYRFKEVEPRVPEIVDYYMNMELPGEKTTYYERRRLYILRARAFSAVLLSTGARLAEVLSLTRENVRDGRAAEVTIVGKGQAERVIYFNATARKAIKAYCAARKDSRCELFISHVRGRERLIGRNEAEKIIKDAAIELGMDPCTSPHSFRHWLAMDMLHNDVPLDVIQKLLGHVSIVTTQIYARSNDERVAMAVKRYQSRR